VRDWVLQWPPRPDAQLERRQSEALLAKHQQADARIRAVWPGENVQFALGCNLGFAASAGAQVVFLNNDCRVQSGWLEALLAPLADPEVAAVQPRLLKPDGTVQCLGVVFREGQTPWAIRSMPAWMGRWLVRSRSIGCRRSRGPV